MLAFCRGSELGAWRSEVLARRVYLWLTPDTHAWPALAFRVAHHVFGVAGLVALVMDTVGEIHARVGPALDMVFDATLAFFTIEYAIRLWAASEAPWAHQGHPWRARWQWAIGPGILDLLGLLPLVAMLAGVPVIVARVLGVLWILKFGRYSQGMAMVGRVLRNARGPVESLFLAFLVVLLMAATLQYLAENKAQPEAFSSIPAALYWAVTTLTTTGYGDVVPLTSLGRFIAGVVMICGIATFAFLAGILANSFAEEMHRREFLRTWDLVARVPFFRDVGAATIAEVTKLLRTRDAPAGTIITRRGEPGDCMYFIADGEVSIQIEPKPLVLSTGQFFGEIALVTGSPRTATVVARKSCQLLLLDIADFRRLASAQPDLMRAIDEEARRRMGHAPQPQPRAAADT
jgi:voltage-gated potassium channel